MRRSTPIFRSIESFYGMLGRGAQKKSNGYFFKTMDEGGCD